MLEKSEAEAIPRRRHSVIRHPRRVALSECIVQIAESQTRGIETSLCAAVWLTSLVLG
jgi:hypothetical protein